MIAQTFQIQIIKINFLIIQDCIMKTKRFIHYCRLLKYKVVPGSTHNVHTVLHISIK
jgi:hypothetical protein